MTQPRYLMGGVVDPVLVRRRMSLGVRFRAQIRLVDDAGERTRVGGVLDLDGLPQ